MIVFNKPMTTVSATAFTGQSPGRLPSSKSMNSILALFFYGSLLFCIQGSKRKRESSSENIILDDDTEPVKKTKTTCSEEARSLLQTVDVEKSDFVSYLKSCSRMTIAEDFALFYHTDPYLNSREDIATALVDLEDATLVISLLSQSNEDYWVDLLAAAKKLVKSEVFTYCVSIVSKDPLLKEKAFRSIFQTEPRGRHFDLNILWIFKWASVVCPYHRESISDCLVIPKSSNAAVSYLLSVLKEPEIDYLLHNILRMRLYDILYNIINIIIAGYPETDDYSIIAKMTAIDLAEGSINERISINERSMAKYDTSAQYFKSTLIGKTDLCREAIKVAMSSKVYPNGFKAIVAAIGKKSKELLHFGAIEFLLHFEEDYEEKPQNIHLLYDFSNFNPSYKNFYIFEFIIRKFKWEFFMQRNLFVGSKWHTANCIKNITRILTELIREIASGFQSNGNRLRIGTYYPLQGRFVLYKHEGKRRIALDDQAETVLSLCKYIYSHEPAPHKELRKVIEYLSLYIPELLPYFHNDLGSFITSYLHSSGTSYIKTAIELKSLDAAIYASRMIKRHVAQYLYDFYDHIPQSEFQVPFERVNPDGSVEIVETPFFNTILFELYKDTLYNLMKILLEDEHWEFGKHLLFSIASNRDLYTQGITNILKL